MLRCRDQRSSFHGLECWFYLGGMANNAPNRQVRIFQAVARKDTYYSLSRQIQPLAAHLHQSGEARRGSRFAEDALIGCNQSIGILTLVVPYHVYGSPGTVPGVHGALPAGWISDANR